MGVKNVSDEVYVLMPVNQTPTVLFMINSSYATIATTITPSLSPDGFIYHTGGKDTE